jgi:predicted ATP-dependent Lon-type protease
LLKLVYPHRTSDDLADEELRPCIDLAIECRARIIDQLTVLAPAEFKPAKFEVKSRGQP